MAASAVPQGQGVVPGAGLFSTRLDTLSHLKKQSLEPSAAGSLLQSQVYGGSLGAHDKKMDDHTALGTLLPDIGNAFFAPRYGGGHDDKDTLSSLKEAMEPSLEGSRSVQAVLGQHYGGGHEGDDTFSNLANGTLIPVQPKPTLTAYGLEARRILSKASKRPPKAKIGYDGMLENLITLHNVDDDVRFRDHRLKRRGNSLHKGTAQTHPRFGIHVCHDAVVGGNECDVLPLAGTAHLYRKSLTQATVPWFKKSKTREAAPVIFPGYIQKNMPLVV